MNIITIFVTARFFSWIEIESHVLRLIESSPVHREHFRVEEVELDEVDLNVEEMCPITQSHSQTDYGSFTIMTLAFSSEYYDSRVGQLSLYIHVDPLTSVMENEKIFVLWSAYEGIKSGRSTNKNPNQEGLEVEDDEIKDDIDFLLITNHC